MKEDGRKISGERGGLGREGKLKECDTYVDKVTWVVKRG